MTKWIMTATRRVRSERIIQVLFCVCPGMDAFKVDMSGAPCMGACQDVHVWGSKMVHLGGGLVGWGGGAFDGGQQ